MWEHCYKEWDTRNKARHGKNNDSKAHRSTRALFLHAQRHSFYPTVEEHFHIETDIQNLETWLETYEPMIMQNAKHRKSILDGRLRQIDEVFRLITERTSTHNVTSDNLMTAQTSIYNTPHHCYSPKGSISNNDHTTVNGHTTITHRYKQTTTHQQNHEQAPSLHICSPSQPDELPSASPWSDQSLHALPSPLGG